MNAGECNSSVLLPHRTGDGISTKKNSTEDLRLGIHGEMSRLHSLSDMCTRPSRAQH